MDIAIWQEGRDDGRLPQKFRHRSVSAAPTGTLVRAATHSTGLRPWLPSFAPIGAGKSVLDTIPDVSRSRAEEPTQTTPVATFPRPSRVSISLRVNCYRPVLMFRHFDVYFRSIV